MGKKKQKVRAEAPIERATFPWTRALLVLLAATLPFLGALGGEYLSLDDNWLFRDNARLHAFDLRAILLDLDPKTRFALGGEYLPVRDLSVAIGFAIFGPGPGPVHAINVLLHGLAAVFLFRSAARLAGESAGFWCALLFAVHPIHVESVAWCAGRKDVLSGAFFFLSLWFYLADRRAGAVAAFFLAMGSKSTALPLPAVLLIAELFRGERSFAVLARRLAPFAVVAALWLAMILHVGAQGLIKAPHGGSVASAVYATGGIFLRYLQLLALPFGQSPSHYVGVAAMNTPLNALAWIALLALGGAAFAFRRRLGVLSFAVFAWFVLLLPVSNLISIPTMMAERYLYLPSFAFCLALGVLAARTKDVARTPIWGALAAGLAGLTLLYTPTFRDSNALFTRAVAVNPEDPNALSSLAKVRYNAAKEKKKAAPAEAKALLEEAARLQDRAIAAMLGDFADAHYDRALVAAELGDSATAIRHYEAAAKDGKRVEAAYNLGSLHLAESRFDEAERWLREALARDPAHAGAHNNLAVALLRGGHEAEAMAEYEKMLARDPKHASALFNLAVYDARNGRKDEAIAKLRRVLAVSPERHDAQKMLADLEGQ